MFFLEGRPFCIHLFLVVSEISLNHPLEMRRPRQTARITGFGQRDKSRYRPRLQGRGSADNCSVFPEASWILSVSWLIAWAQWLKDLPILTKAVKIPTKGKAFFSLFNFSLFFCFCAFSSSCFRFFSSCANRFSFCA